MWEFFKIIRLPLASFSLIRNHRSFVAIGKVAGAEADLVGEGQEVEEHELATARSSTVGGSLSQAPVVAVACLPPRPVPARALPCGAAACTCAPPSPNLAFCYSARVATYSAPPYTTSTCCCSMGAPLCLAQCRRRLLAARHAGLPRPTAPPRSPCHSRRSQWEGEKK